MRATLLLCVGALCATVALCEPVDVTTANPVTPAANPAAAAKAQINAHGTAAHTTVYNRGEMYRASANFDHAAPAAVAGSSHTVVGDAETLVKSIYADGDGPHPDQRRVVKRRADKNAVPVHEYYSSRLRDHLYTLKKSDLEATHTGGPVVQPESWSYSGISFFVSKKQLKGQVPLLVYFNLNRGDHVLTTDQTKYGDAGLRAYRPRGTLGYVWKKQPSAAEDAILIFEYYDERRGDHIYSPDHRLDMNPHDPRAVDYAYVGPAFYTRRGPFFETARGTTVEERRATYNEANEGKGGKVARVRVLTDDPIPVPDPDTPLSHPVTFNWTDAADAARTLPSRPIYRYYSLFDEDSLLTTDYNLLRTGAGGWKLSKEIGEGYPGDVEGTVPLLRYFNQRTRSHFYTVDALPTGAQFGWVFLGGETFVYREKPDHIDTVALIRHFNDITSSYAWTYEGESTSRIEALGYYRETVVCHMVRRGLGAEVGAAKMAAAEGQPFHTAPAAENAQTDGPPDVATKTASHQGQQQQQQQQQPQVEHKQPQVEHKPQVSAGAGVAAPAKPTVAVTSATTTKTATPAIPAAPAQAQVLPAAAGKSDAAPPPPPPPIESADVPSGPPSATTATADKNPVDLPAVPAGGVPAAPAKAVSTMAQVRSRVRSSRKEETVEERAERELGTD